jgi:hypothetical protein
MACLEIFENDIVFRKTDLVICHLEVILLKNESSNTLYTLHSSVVLVSYQYTLM